MSLPSPTSKGASVTLSGLFAVSALPGAINHFSMPIQSLDSNGTTTTDWDVDQDSTADFSFNKSVSGTTIKSGYFDSYLSSYVTTTSYYTTTYAFHDLAGNGQNSLLKSGYLLNLNPGEQVGPLATGSPRSFAGQATLFYSSGSLYPPGFSSGVTGYIGFRFGGTGPTDSHYGWARITLTESGFLGDAVIHEWAYNTVAGASIAVGAIPEPETAAAGLGALALGAAGLRRWRKKKQQAA
ncbi:MAG: hypothetical protein ACFE0O_02270 [Opitutales bacterium]